jgi:hypothetical protein
MLNKSIPLWILVAAEAMLIFFLGILGNKVATLVDISATPIYLFTLVGLLGLVGIIYLRLGESSNPRLVLYLINQVKRLKERIPFFNPDPLERFKSEGLKYSERAMNRWVAIALIGGFISYLGNALPSSAKAKLFWSGSLALVSSGILTAHMLRSLKVESRLKREKSPPVRTWEVIMMFFMFLCPLVPGWYLANLSLAVLSWLFGP